MKLQMWKPKHPPGSVDTTSSITASSASQLRHRLDATMFRPHQSSSTTLSSVEIPLIHFNKAPAQSEASLRSTDSRTLSSSSLPKPAQTFRRSRSNASLEILADVIFALLSAVFFVYGLYVVRYNGKAIADYPEVTDRLINATKIGPTIFPILFAAVLGRALKAIMLWRLERGERLGLLDLLAGSTTVVNTILTQLSLRILNAASLILIIAWAISPLGGQASLRVMTVARQNATTSAPMRYLSTNHSYDPYVSGDLGSLATLMDGLFNAALLGPERVKNSPTDTWNNVKVPRLESLTSDPSLLANNSWILVPDENVTYASLIGLPVADIPAASNASFTMESFYWNLDCSALTNSFQPPSYQTSYAVPAGWSNRTNDLGNIHLLDYAPRTSNESSCRGSPYDPDYVPRVLAYDSWDPSGAQFGALCTISTSYVEIEAECMSATNCSATAIRNSTQKHPNPAWTTLDGPEGACNWYIYFLYQFVDTVTVKRSGTSTPAQGYLLDPNSPASPLLDKPMTSVPKETFAIRLAQLLNTFWVISAGPYAIPYGFAGDIDNTNQEYYDATAANATTTTAHVTTTYNVIRCHRAWLGVLLAASIFLIFASILSIVLRLRSKTPDLSLNWSTLTRDNPYVETEYTGSSLDHTKRSRLMKSKKVRFGDVEPERDVGHLAVGSLEAHVVSKADKSRVFD